MLAALRAIRISTQLHPLNKKFSYCQLKSIRWNSSDSKGLFQAAVLKAVNEPLVITELPTVKKLNEKEVRVGVYYCSLNQTDVNQMKKGYSGAKDPIIPGCEFSGEVLEIGDSTTKVHKGAKVVSLVDYKQPGGGLGTDCIVHEDNCFVVDNVSLKDSAILLYGHGTAFLAFTKYCELKENDKVIVFAGPAGFGLAAIEIAANVFKAKVYAISDTDEISDLLRHKGAYKAITVNEGPRNIYKFLEENFKDVKAKAVYDAVGQGLMYIASDFVDPENGCFLTPDPYFDRTKFETTKPEVDFRKSKKKDKKSIAPNEENNFADKIIQVDLYAYKSRDEDFYRRLISNTFVLFEEELIDAHISQTFSLKKVNKAVEYIKSKTCTGKVLIDVRKDPDDDSDDEGDKKKDK